MKILSRPKNNAEEYGKWAVNPYIGCPNQCRYCYLNQGPSAGYLGQPHAVLKKGIVSPEHACHLAIIEILENEAQIKKDGGLFFTFTSDPLLPDTRDVCLTIASLAIRHDIPVTMLTKSTSFYSFIDCIENAKHYIWDPILDLDKTIYSLQRLAIGFTLTGHDELEQHADSNEHRIAAMLQLSSEGFKTWASIEPVIDFDSSLRMIQQALDAGCRHFKIGLMTRGTKVCRKGFTLGVQTFEPYDPARCLAFVQDVMVQTRDRATVYWKQSFRDFIGGTAKHRLFKDDELHKIFDDYPHAVGKDWSMFNKK